MRVVAEFPRPVRRIEHVWIPLRRRHAAWPRASGCPRTPRRPGAGGPRVHPLPQARRHARSRRRRMHPYFAGHGYAAVRVDLRGSGESDGVLLDEYLPQEQEDGVEVIAWLAAQPWCTGAVGHDREVVGRLQRAPDRGAPRRRRCKAIITVCSTDDRYADDVHYMGGCLLARLHALVGVDDARLQRAPARPRGGRRALARHVARAARGGEPLPVERWLAPPAARRLLEAGLGVRGLRRDRVPVYAVGGWADALPQRDPAPARAASTCPRKGLIGPWGHVYPHEGVPGPAIGFLQESLRWWDHWLKGEDTRDRWTSRAARSGCRTRVPPRGALRRAARPLGRRGELAVAARSRHASVSLTSAAWRRTRATGERSATRPADAGRRRGPGAPYGNPADLPRRPARRGRALALLRRARRSRSGSSCSASRRSSSRSRPTGRSRSSRAALRRRARRQLAARHPRPAQPHAPRRPRAPGAARARARRSTVGRAARRHRARLPRRAPHPARALARYWPWVWPVARAGHAHADPARGERARAAGAPAARRGRRAAPLRRARGRAAARESRRSSRTTAGARGSATSRTGARSSPSTGPPAGATGSWRPASSAGCWATTTYSIVPGDPLSAEVRCETATELGARRLDHSRRDQRGHGRRRRALPRADRARGVRERRARAAPRVELRDPARARLAQRRLDAPAPAPGRRRSAPRCARAAGRARSAAAARAALHRLDEAPCPRRRPGCRTRPSASIHASSAPSGEEVVEPGARAVRARPATSARSTGWACPG